MFQFIVPSSSEDELEKIKKDNPNFKKNRGHCLLEIPYGSLDTFQIESLKRTYPQGFFRLMAWEKGGGNFDDGLAQVVTNELGEMLVPNFIRNKGYLANKEHALFLSSKPLYVVEASHSKGEEAKFTVYRLSLHKSVGAVKEVVWDGVRSDVEAIHNYTYKPKEHHKLDLGQLVFFLSALNAALSKANSYRCTRPEFFKYK